MRTEREIREKMDGCIEWLNKLPWTAEEAREHIRIIISALLWVVDDEDDGIFGLL